MCRVGFTITNRIDSSRPPITPELVEKLMCGEARTHPAAPALCSALEPRLPLASPEPSVAPATAEDQPPVAPAPAVVEDQPPRPDVEMEVEEIPPRLQHVYMAAQVHNMQVSLTQADDIVQFHANVEAELETSFVSDSVVAASVQAFPQGLTIFCLEDSDVARRLLLHALGQGMAGCAVKVFGRTAEEVAQFMAEAVLAHILIMDQHLDYGQEAFLGTDLIRTLRSTGYDGFICMRSANVAREDRALYEESGVHCVVGKEVRAQRFVTTLKSAYMDHIKKEVRVHELICKCSRQNSSACLPIVASYRAAMAANFVPQPRDLVAAFDSLRDIGPSDDDMEQVVSPTQGPEHEADYASALPGSVCTFSPSSTFPSPSRLLALPNSLFNQHGDKYCLAP
eukprot:EG_transcript_11683